MTGTCAAVAVMSLLLHTSPAPQTPEEGVEDSTRTVVVTGTRTERRRTQSPVATEVIEREEIESSGAENLAEVLEEEPGAQVVRSFRGAAIRLRGLDPEYTLILVDGQRMTGRIGGAIDLQRFPVEDMERIEIVKGPSSVLYGSDALAGTINVISRRPSRPLEAETHAAYGSFNTADLSTRIAITRKRWSQSIVAGWHRTDGWDRAPETPATTGNAMDQWSASTRGELGWFGPLRVTGRAEYLRRDMRGIDASATGAVFDRRNLTEVVTASLSPELVSGASRLQMTGHYNLFVDQFVQDQRASDELDQFQRTTDQIGQISAQYDHTFNDAHVFSVGNELLHEVLTTDRLDRPAAERTRYALFAQHEWVPSTAHRVALLPGMRVDIDSQFGIYPTPRIALLVAPIDRLVIRTNYGAGFRAPSFRELYLRFANPGANYMVQGNPDLGPETSWGFVLDAELEATRWLVVSGSVFDNRLSNAIVVDTLQEATAGDPSVFGYTNVGAAFTRGVESGAHVRPLPWLRLEGSYTFLDTRDLENDRPLPGRARHAGTAGLTLHHNPWGTQVRVRSGWFGPRPFFADTDGDAESEAVLDPAFGTLDVRIAQTFWRDRITLFIGAENLLDAGNATTTPLPPRSFYGGITLRYATPRR